MLLSLGHSSILALIRDDRPDFCSCSKGSPWMVCAGRFISMLFIFLRKVFLSLSSYLYPISLNSIVLLLPLWLPEWLLLAWEYRFLVPFSCVKRWFGGEGCDELNMLLATLRWELCWLCITCLGCMLKEMFMLKGCFWQLFLLFFISRC